jgi:transposase
MKTTPELPAKSDSKSKKKGNTTAKSFSIINPNAAGIDIGADSHWVSVPQSRDAQPVRRFGCFTSDLYALANWLKECQVETVAMESTGVYWIRLFQILETQGLEVKLVNAHHVKSVPGRKSDVLDCQWLQQLHSYGLLSGSFRPDDQICVLHSYIRQRDTLIKSASIHVQRMQKALTQMNLQLHRVISDITGTTGMAIIRAIIAGERNPQVLAALKNSRIKSSASEIAHALTGDYRVEHIFVLQQELQLYEIYQKAIAECDYQIEQCMAQFSDQVSLVASPILPPKYRRNQPQGNQPSFDLRTHLYRISGVDFTQIDGLGVLTVQTILSEVGLDSTRFPSVKHFCSWLGLCPGSRITGGKVKSSQTRCVVNRAANAFRMAAQALKNSRSALGAFYRRLRSRLGTPKAITATAHKIARLFYYLWCSGEAYVDPGVDYYEQKYQERLVHNLIKKAHSLGFELIPQSVSPSVTDFVS